MKVIISGCGRVGTAILESLLKEEHQITVIDLNPNIVEEVTNKFDVLGLVGNGTSYDVLLSAGANEADLFVSVTASDEFNMLSCFVAKKMGATNTVARIRNSEYNNASFGKVRKELGINVIINPELLTAQTIYNVLQLPSASNVEVFSSSETEMMEITLNENSKILGQSLLELRKKHNYTFLVCLVQRDDAIYIPNGSFVLQAGDKIGIFTSKANVSKLIKSFGLEQKSVKSIMIVGASKTAFYLAKLLSSTKYSVKIIDSNKDKCERIARELDNVTIINGDGMSQELLLEEGILTTDGFVALTGKDETNVLMSIFSQNNNVQKTITKLDNDEVFSISKTLGLETSITARHLVANVVVRYARALENSKESKIETLYSLFSGKAEAAEFEVLPDFKFINTPIKALKLSKQIIIAGIIRDRETIIPCGEDVIMTGDRVIVITAGRSLYDLSDIMD